MTPTDVVNIALTQVGIQEAVSSIDPSDGSAAADAAAILYQPKIDSLLRGANWNFCRKQASLSLLKSATINGVASDDPPPVPWLYEYAWPEDCIRARSIIPYAASGTELSIPLTTADNIAPLLMIGPAIPFIISTDLNAAGDTIKVILTNRQNAILIYTAMAPDPSLWDVNFLDAASAYLGAWLINALSRNRGNLQDMISIVRDIVGQARVTDGNEGPSSADHLPDWMQVRGFSGDFLNRSMYYATWDLIGFPNGLMF